MRVFVLTQISWLRCSDTLQDSRCPCRAARVCHGGGAGLSPCARNTIREAISRDTSTRAASMQDTLSEGTARAAQLAPSAVTVSAVGGSATRRICHQKCGCRLSPTNDERASGRLVEEHARAIARRRGHAYNEYWHAYNEVVACVQRAPSRKLQNTGNIVLVLRI